MVIGISFAVHPCRSFSSFFCLSPRIESDSQILQADEYLHDRIRLCRLIESDSRLPAIADTRQGEVLEGPAAAGEDGRRGKGIRCSSAACSWATDKWACMCGAHMSGTPLQGTQLQRISFPFRGAAFADAPSSDMKFLFSDTTG